MESVQTRGQDRRTISCSLSFSSSSASDTDEGEDATITDPNGDQDPGGQNRTNSCASDTDDDTDEDEDERSTDPDAYWRLGQEKMAKNQRKLESLGLGGAKEVAKKVVMSLMLPDSDGLDLLLFQVSLWQRWRRRGGQG
jgi:hypothetical protein